MKTKLIALAVAAAVSFSANAAIEDTFSAGIAAGYNKQFQRKDTFTETDSDGYAVKLNGEYNFTSWFGLGAGYDYLSGGEYNNDKMHENVAELYARFALPLDDNGSDLFFKVGPTYNWASWAGEKSNEVGAVAGVGFQYAFNNTLAIRVGYDYFYKTANKLAGDGRKDNGVAYLGLEWTFGAPAPVVAAPATKTVRVTQKHTLDADILFPFDGSKLTAEGNEAVATIVTKSAALDNAEYAVYGHTDRIGSDAYNLKLSQKRADAVAAQLKADGIDSITTSEGRGKSEPVTGDKCNGVKGRQAVIDCLAPDRRVEIVVTGDQQEVVQD